MALRDETEWRWVVLVANVLLLTLMVLVFVNHWVGEMRLLIMLGIAAAGLSLYDVAGRMPTRHPSRKS